MGVPFLKFPIICGVGAAVLLATVGCNRSGSTGGSSNAVATVGKDAITEKEFFGYLQRKPTVTVTNVSRSQPPTAIISDTVGFQALKDLIVNKVILQLAKDEGVFPTQKQVDDEFESQRGQQPRLIEMGLLKGMSVEDLKAEFQLELARYNIQVKGFNETTQDAKDYIHSHPKDFMDSPQIQAQVMIVKKADMKAVDSALASGQPFSTVAKQFTLDKEAYKVDYRYNANNPNLLSYPPQIQALFNKTDDGRMTDWQPLGKTDTFFKFYVMKKEPAKPTAETPLLLEKVRRGLAQKKSAEGGRDANKMIATKIRNMKDQIKINIKQDSAPWDDFVKKLGDELNQAANMGAPAPGGGPAKPAPAGTAAPAGKK